MKLRGWILGAIVGSCLASALHAAPIRLKISLVDGSVVHGTAADLAEVKLQAPYAVVAFDLAKVKVIDFMDGPEVVTVQMNGGDKLSGKLLLADFAFETLLGKTTVPVARLKAIEVLAPKPEETAK